MPIVCFKVPWDSILVSMHLCKEYARSAMVDTDNTANIYEKVPLNILFLPQ